MSYIYLARIKTLPSSKVSFSPHLIGLKRPSTWRAERGGNERGEPVRKEAGRRRRRGEELKTCSWWVTRGCNYRDVRGRVLSQSASARSVSEPPRKRGFAPAGRIFNRVLNKESLSSKREREREEDLSERRLRILAWMPRKRACARVLACFVCRETSCLSFVSSRIIVYRRNNRSMTRNNQLGKDTSLRLNYLYEVESVEGFSNERWTRVKEEN